MLNHGVVSSLMETVPLSSSSSGSSTNSIFSEQSSLTTNGSLGDSDDENDVLFFPLMQYLMSGRRRHRIENYLIVTESWTELEFKEHLRLSRNIAYQLIDEIEISGFMPQHCFGMIPITGKLSVLIFLWYMANTEPLRTISDRFDVSISSVFRVIRRVIAWILTKSNVIIKWPETHNSIVVVTDGFFCKKGLSNVLGAIDCTHIRIEKPSINEKDYYNRKKFCSINLQAVVDANMRFTNIYCGEPGSLHDARVLRRSSLYEEANENKEALFPNNTFIIGDSAYPSLPWLVPPFRDNGHLTAQQTEFNYLHSSTRMAVEKAFGHLKGRFRRIKFFTEYKDIRFITNTVMAACILHNLCINEKDNFDIDESDDQFHIDNTANFFQENVNDEIATDRRMQLFRELFPEN